MLLWFVALTIGLLFYLLSDFDEFVEDVKPPKIKVYGIDIFPLIKKIFKIMPDSTRKNFTIKMVNIYIVSMFFLLKYVVHFIYRVLLIQIHLYLIHIFAMAKIHIMLKKYWRTKCGVSLMILNSLV